MNELDDLRSRIRDLDERILQLVCERITLVDRRGRRLIHIITRGA
jgi:chorismate mutase